MSVTNLPVINRQQLNQAGMVSIVVTMIMLIVISLIIAGFAGVARRNSRVQLNNQLSTQAYYAAETGVNAAYKAIQAGYAVRPSDATSCTSFIANAHLNSNLTPGISYSCVLVTDHVPDYEGDIGYGESKVFSFTPSANTNIVLSWQAKGTGIKDASNCPGVFTTVATWTAGCPYALLRADLVDNTAGNNADQLAANTASMYMLPAPSGSGAINPNYGHPMNFKAACSAATSTCSTTLNNFTAGVTYHMRLNGIYMAPGAVVLTPTNTSATFTGQSLIDVTGKAQDELRRIQIRLQTTGASDSFSLQDAIASGAAVCKRFTIDGSGSSANPDWNNATPLCAP